MYIEARRLLHLSVHGFSILNIIYRTKTITHTCSNLVPACHVNFVAIVLFSLCLESFNLPFDKSVGHLLRRIKQCVYIVVCRTRRVQSKISGIVDPGGFVAAESDLSHQTHTKCPAKPSPASEGG